MIIDYNYTFKKLKEIGMIKEGDKYAVCYFQPESRSNGVVTTTITSKVDYVMVANDEEVKLLNIDKKTGEFLEDGIVFKKENLVFEKKNKNWVYASKGLFGGRYVVIRADHVIEDGERFCHTYNIPKKMHGFEQLALRTELYDFIKAVYNAHHDAMKQLYKENKKKKD